MKQKISRKIFWKITLSTLLALSFMTSFSLASEEIFLDENFSNLYQWSPLTFPKINRHSSYTITECGNNNCLKMESNNSASALILNNTFSVYQFPILKWRWKVSNVYQKGNSATKEGDDYPARLYVLFMYNPKQSSTNKRIQYELAKLFYGQYPPDSSISYIWDNKTTNKLFIVNAYTDRARMIPVSSGSSQLNTWQEYTVNIVNDYKMAFGQDPPSIASLAVMCDADNTHESAMSFLQYIRIETLH